MSDTVRCGRVPNRSYRPWWVGYVVALVLQVALAAGLVAVHRHLPLGSYPIVYAVALMAVAYWFGWGPAILAFVVGLFVFAYYFVPPRGLTWPPSRSPFGWAMFAAFFLGTAAVGFAIALIRSAQHRAELLAAELLESRQTIQRQLTLLEQALLPPAPAIDSGYSAAVLYRPAFPGEQIGGDFYDIFFTEDRQIAVVIGDVAGKGIESAALAAAARSTIRSFAYELSHPGSAIRHANAVLASHRTGSGVFVTALLIVIDPHTGRLSYARAGHPPAALVRTGGQVDFLEEGGVPIGPSTRAEWETFQDRLNPGDTIVLYTDGILEARRGADLFETEGIQEALCSHWQDTPDEMAGGLLDAARAWAHDQLRDDVAIVVIGRSADRAG